MATVLSGALVSAANWSEVLAYFIRNDWVAEAADRAWEQVADDVRWRL